MYSCIIDLCNHHTGVRAGIELTELMAASYGIPAVEKFDFAKPEEWPRWIRRFERFRQASDLAINKHAGLGWTDKNRQTIVVTELIYVIHYKHPNISKQVTL